MPIDKSEKQIYSLSFIGELCANVPDMIPVRDTDRVPGLFVTSSCHIIPLESRANV